MCAANMLRRVPELGPCYLCFLYLATSLHVHWMKCLVSTPLRRRLWITVVATSSQVPPLTCALHCHASAVYLWHVGHGSGGVERNAIIGDNAEARKADIPIVQLNPGGTLNYKYMGEAAVRSAGVPYTVIRSTGARAQAVRGVRKSLRTLLQRDARCGFTCWLSFHIDHTWICFNSLSVEERPDV